MKRPLQKLLFVGLFAVSRFGTAGARGTLLPRLMELIW